MEVQPLAGEIRRVYDLQKRLDVKAREFELIKKDLEAKQSVLKEQSPDIGTQRSN